MAGKEVIVQFKILLTRTLGNTCTMDNDLPPCMCLTMESQLPSQPLMIREVQLGKLQPCILQIATATATTHTGPNLVPLPKSLFA